MAIAKRLFINPERHNSTFCPTIGTETSDPWKCRIDRQTWRGIYMKSKSGHH